MSLSDAMCRAAKSSEKNRKLSDGEGLQLVVRPNGSKLWWLAYRHNSKPKTLSLGAYPTVSLLDARQGRDDAKRLLAKGIDPLEARKAAKAEQASIENTFRTIAEEYVIHQRRNERAPVTITKLEWVLEFAYPTLGDKKITEIRAPDILSAIRKVEARGRIETAHRLLSTIGSVFRFAVASGRAENDPTPMLRGSLVQRRPTPHAAITDPRAFGALLRAIDGYDGQPVTTAALKLMALLYQRPGELRQAEWKEFDLDKAIWVIPSNRMKMRREHKIPLSLQAVAILRDLYRITGNGNFVFPSIRTGAKPLSENTLNAALRCLGYDADTMCAHGFRSSAATLLNESRHWHPDAIERQLAHIESNNVRRAYTRGAHWDERIKMMSWWGDHLDYLKAGGKIILAECNPIRAGQQP